MATLTIIEKVNGSGDPVNYGRTLTIDTEKLIGKSTQSLYIRTGKMNGTRFLSQRGNGSDGAGDICSIENDSTIYVSAALFNRIEILANKQH